MTLDPITTEVIISRIRETTAAMAHALFHSGYSPILRESQDGTAGLCDAERPRHHGGRRAAVSLAALHARRRERVRALSRRRHARRRQLHLQRSLQGRQLARARHGGDHADLSWRRDHRLRRQRRAQGRCRRPGAGIVRRRGARDFSRRRADPAGQVLDERRRQPRGRGDPAQQQPRARGRRRRPARPGRQHEARRRAPGRAVRRVWRRDHAGRHGKPARAHRARACAPSWRAGPTAKTAPRRCSTTTAPTARSRCASR